MLTQDKPIAQVRTPQVWDKVTNQANVGDYFHVPFTPVMQVVEKGTHPDGRVWLLVKPVSASYTEEWLLQPELPESEQQQSEPQPQPIGFAGDSVSCELQQTQQARTEFLQGKHQGREDAIARLHPMYTQPSISYAAGYLEGYNCVLNPLPQTEVTEAPTWLIQYDSKWDWYQVWVSEQCIGHVSNHQEAEQIAQRYIAADQFWQDHRQKVIDAYAG